MAGKYRQKLNAATMLGQSKTTIQAEIDSAAELIDFIRFNAFFLKENAKYQPISEDIKVTKNSVRFRGLDGFIAAIAPFNFTAIGGNLSYTPAMMVSLLQNIQLCKLIHVFFSREILFYGSQATLRSYQIGQFMKSCEKLVFQRVLW